jgi:PAS domain S-box-containing protein
VQPADPDAAPPPGPGAEFFKVLLERHANVIVVLGEDGTIRYATPSAAALFGQERIIGAHLPDLVGQDARPEIAEAVGYMLGRASPDTEGIPEDIWQITSQDGRSIHVEVHSSDLRGTPAVGGVNVRRGCGGWHPATR